MANSLWTVNLDNKITKVDFDTIKNLKEIDLMNWYRRSQMLWFKYKYDIHFENIHPQVYFDLMDLINANPVQTLILDQDPINTYIGAWVPVYCKLSNVKHTAGSVVQNKDNYRVTFDLTCEEQNPR